MITSMHNQSSQVHQGDNLFPTFTCRSWMREKLQNLQQGASTVTKTQWGTEELISSHHMPGMEGLFPGQTSGRSNAWMVSKRVMVGNQMMDGVMVYNQMVGKVLFCQPGLG